MELFSCLLGWLLYLVTSMHNYKLATSYVQEYVEQRKLLVLRQN